jgi:hypothetical protein
MTEDPRLLLHLQHEAKRIADAYGVWDREKKELHILQALRQAAGAVAK